MRKIKNLEKLPNFDEAYFESLESALNSFKEMVKTGKAKSRGNQISTLRFDYRSSNSSTGR